MRLFTLFVKYGSVSDPYSGVYASIEFLHEAIKEIAEKAKIPRYEVPSVEHIEECLAKYPCMMVHVFSNSTWLYIQEVEPGLITHVKNAVIKEIKDSLLECVDAEPEFPGDMPEKRWEDLKKMVNKGDKEAAISILRSVVTATKEGIAERIAKSNI